MLKEETIVAWVKKLEQLDDLGRMLMISNADTLLNHQRLEQQLRKKKKQSEDLTMLERN